jgi:hypothetical protein
VRRRSEKWGKRGTLVRVLDRSETDWLLGGGRYVGGWLDELGGIQPLSYALGLARAAQKVGAIIQAEWLSLDQTVDEVDRNTFEGVIRPFHNLGDDTSFQGKFYRTDFGRALELADALHVVADSSRAELEEELDAHWALLEGAFTMRHDNFELANDLRLTFLAQGYKRKNLTSNIPFLQGYQGNTYFYCGEPMTPDDVEVDHVLPRQVVCRDEIWNLVLAHGLCNRLKSDHVVGDHRMRKLIARNENIMGSNHPWRKRIESALGSTSSSRGSTLMKHYGHVKLVLGSDFWGGSASYNPEHDPFYGRLITVLNNGAPK